MKSPNQLIQQAMKQYNSDKFIMLYSGGNDSTSTLHAVLKTQRESDKKFEIKLMYWNTMINSDDNRDFVYHQADKYGLELIELKPELHFRAESLFDRFGFLGVGGHPFALGFLKWFGFRKFAKENKLENYIYVSGRRLLESEARTKMISNKDLDKPEPNMNFVSPLFYLSNPQRDFYMIKHNLHSSPCYATLKTDGNCFCGCYAGAGELANIWLFDKPLFERIRKLEERFGGIREIKVIDKLTKCPKCGVEGHLHGGDTTRWKNGIHTYLYECWKCFSFMAIPDEQLPYHIEFQDMGTWGNGVSTKEIMANPPPEDNLICHGCKQAFLMKKKLIYGGNNA